ncbi:MAG TPA: DEAD/DEAH box helicase, partial [Anaerolineae bacterium]|nr:DEAD/DEAH box helicase [Anaerolineae bacterium]
REKAIRQAIAARSPLPPRFPAPHLTHGYGKVPLAGYIKKTARGRLDLCLVDEQHQYKGDDSDQGYAMHHLALAARKIVGLTGTIYGGKASSIFHLLYRMSPEMTAVYTNPDAHGRRRIRSKDWVASYGILQRIETRKLDEDGRQTANSRTNVRYKELPGGSPAMLPWLLNRSVFLSLGDMGFPLPEYTEIPVEVPMAPEQAMLYETLKGQLKDELKERLVRGDKSLLSAYLYALLFWPDSPRRAKVVNDPRTGETVAAIPGLPEEFVGPKEVEIIELCRQEKAAGRKVLLLCLQTDTLDIQPEWKRMLEEAGLKTAVLRAAPNKREGWVEKQVQAGVDVIISHPKKVETGIDLLDFPTIVWMSPHYSVYTVLQASRRSWRIGQTKPVKVYYFAYADTIQEQALYLVAAKVAAALRVNGDTVSDDSLAELDSITGNDIVATLARIVTGDTELNTRSLQQAFAEANASLRQANAVIGEYEIVDDEPEPEISARDEAWTPVVDEPVFAGKQQALFRGNGHTANGKSSSAATSANGRSRSRLQPNGNGHSSGNGRSQRNGHKPKDEMEEKRPPVPRPRLLIGQLAGRS